LLDIPRCVSFQRKFLSVLAGPRLSLFDDKELELLISGLPDIDIEDPARAVALKKWIPPKSARKNRDGL